MPRRDPETLSLAAPSCFPRLPGCAREGPVLTRAHFWLQGLVRWQLGTRSLRQVRDPPVALPTSGLLPVGLHLEWPHLPGTLGRAWRRGGALLLAPRGWGPGMLPGILQCS